MPYDNNGNSNELTKRNVVIAYDRLAYTSRLVALFAVIELFVSVQVFCIVKNPSTKTATFLFRWLIRRGCCKTHTIIIFDKLIIKDNTIIYLNNWGIF